MVTFDYCTPDTGYEPNVMELGTNELNNAASGDIYFQDSKTVSLSITDIDDDELKSTCPVTENHNKNGYVNYTTFTRTSS